VQKRRIWKNRLVALIILQKSTFPDIRDSTPKVWFGRAACTKPKPPLPRIPIYKKNAGRTFRKGEGSACFFAPLPHFSLRRKCATIALA
jgi:hypothetical protein